MRHLVLARSYLLHHKQRKPHKAEAVTEILQHDGTANQHAALRLIYRQQGICHKRQVKDAAQGEQRFPQSAVRYVITGQQRAQHKGGSSVSAVIQPYLLLIQSQAARRTFRLQEKGNNLHDETFGKAIENDKGNIIPYMTFLKEIPDYALQLLQRFARRLGFGSRRTARR